MDLEFVNRELHRRQLGYGRGGRQKIEKDRADIFAGVRHGQTIGAPVALRIENRDWANWEKILAVEAYPEDDSTAKKLVAPRPGHADLAGSQKFNFHDARYILERASARETARPRSRRCNCKTLLRALGTEIAATPFKSATLASIAVPPGRKSTPSQTIWNHLSAVSIPPRKKK
jgi:chorismate synthase